MEQIWSDLDLGMDDDGKAVVKTEPGLSSPQGGLPSTTEGLVGVPARSPMPEPPVATTAPVLPVVPNAALLQSQVGLVPNRPLEVRDQLPSSSAIARQSLEVRDQISERQRGETMSRLMDFGLVSFQPPAPAYAASDGLSAQRECNETPTQVFAAIKARLSEDLATQADLASCKLIRDKLHSLEKVVALAVLYRLRFIRSSLGGVEDGKKIHRAQARGWTGARKRSHRLYSKA